MEASGDRSIAAGGSIGVAISGDNARIVVLPAEAVHWAETIQAPPGAGFLPTSVSGVFVGREQELTDLRRMLAGEGSAAVVQARVQAIHGLGGVGKSALALHYAGRYRDAYTLVWWISAESSEAIVTGLAGLAMRLCPQWAEAVGLDERAAWAIRWLQAHPGWLLIFDNVENPIHLRPYLGTLHRGHHLATSRKATGWHALAPTTALGLLPLDQAADLLCTLAFQHRPPTDGEGAAARELAGVLGCLPLALEQAGAYAHETGTDLDTYRQSLGLVLDHAAEGIDPERTIARIWDHTITAISDRDPLAVTLLQSTAWLAPNDIPRTLLACLVPDPIALSNALGVLHAYNMIAFTDDRQGVSVHRLVQTVLRTRITPEPNMWAPGRCEAEGAVAKALLGLAEEAVPELHEHWDRLLPHVVALAESTPPESLTSPETVAAYHHAAQYLHRQGRDAHTISLRTVAAAQCGRALGENHPHTLTYRHNLAGAYKAAGDLKRAISLYETTLADSERELGGTHPDTLESRNDLAAALLDAGDLERAIPLFETTFAQRVQVLGGTHLATLISLNNLASAYGQVGDLEQVITLFETTLATFEKVMGGTHPRTITCRSNLANTYRDAGDLGRAIPLLETTLSQRVAVLGDIHPDTLASRNTLAATYALAGDLERAIPLFETTLSQRVAVLDDIHPDTLDSRNNLAFAYAVAGDPGRAIPLLETTVGQRVAVLGDVHPGTLDSRNNLAFAYAAAGDLGRAISLFEAILAQRVQVLGDTHPSTLLTRSALAVVRREAQSKEK
ncbi:tetratricopeptide repeat protein [Streptomyces sp. H39-S7]|uniref:tetratricopeptide repeat protein n=1 Tax=Streptomyces sp. H39-S7 TaxID=3004357 RepID=UPI0022AF298B|nr:tetratricopeptide repeat protein [Streptomyces sp. H39-S7]MCZ4125968.1 tetratricopeptide repeat protein [Streptomyces sp. H39-S7]